MLTINEFICFTNSDLKCTNKSEFPLNIQKYKQFVNQVNESIEVDKSCLNKVRKGVKTIYNSGTCHSNNELLFCELLEGIGQNEDDDFDADGDKVATGLCKFAVVMRDLSKKYKQLMQNLGSLVVYPLDMFLKGDIKNDAKKPFEKSIKDYEAKAEKLKKDKLNALNKENASTIYKPNGDAPFDFSEDLERERRIVQIQLCEFLMKVNEIKSRKGAELVQQLIDYYRAQTNYFKDSLLMMEHMGMFMNDLVQHIDEIKNKHIDENQLLANTRKELRSIIEKNTKQVVSGSQPGYSLHQPQGNKAYGTAKEGWLLKKSDGMVKRVWQKRRVKLSGQSMLLYHGDDNKAPVTLPMLTCHIKHPLGGDSDSLCFDLISNNRTYNFRTEDEKSLEEWLSVLSNAKSAVFELAMSLDPNDDDTVSKRSTYSADTDTITQYKSATKSMYSSNNPMISSTGSFKNECEYSPSRRRKILMKKIRKLDGNNKCADCGGIDPEWVSVNLGVLICLECCGVHRELGVHHSRTQSLRMDTFYSSQLLLPRFVGNKLFNDVYEASLPDGIKPPPSDPSHRSDNPSIMQQRQTFIRSKYIDRKYVSGSCGLDKSYLKHDLLLAIQNFSIKDLLQCYGEGVDLMTQFTTDDDPVWGGQLNSSIHLALILAEKSQRQPSNKRVCMYDMNWDKSSNFKTNTSLLTIIEFILQNTPSANLRRVNSKGDTILHQAVISNQVDSVKVIVRAGVICSELMSCKNKDNKTAIDLAESLNRTDLFDILRQTSSEIDKDPYNDNLDDLTINWEITSDKVPSPDSKIPAKDTTDAPSRQSMVDTHIRHDSTSSNKSDASYIDFNHSTLISENPYSQIYTKEQTTESSNPCTGMAFPRRKSIKGPAPVPPVLRKSEVPQRPKEAEILKSPRSRNTAKEKPVRDIVTEIRASHKPIPPLPKGRTKLSSNPNFSNATLPRNMPSSMTNKLPLDSKFVPLTEDDRQQYGASSNLRTSTHLSNSSDHINVLLDVLEEPRKTLNAKEIVHISQPQLLPEKKMRNIGQSSEELKIGVRTSAKYNCIAENSDELSFSKGDIIIVNNTTSEDGWWKFNLEGYLEDDPSRSGYLPSNFVQRLS